jgi:hypothetical protein
VVLTTPLIPLKFLIGGGPGWGIKQVMTTPFLRFQGSAFKNQALNNQVL